MKTHVVIILDKSGSMQSNKARTLSDYNEQVQMCQDIHKKGEQEVLCYFVSFNNDVTEHLWGQPATELQEGTNEQYICNGGTAMYDAQGYTYGKLLERVVPHLGENDAILVQILTDGEENASRKFGYEQVNYPDPKGIGASCFNPECRLSGLRPLFTVLLPVPRLSP